MTKFIQHLLYNRAITFFFLFFPCSNLNFHFKPTTSLIFYHKPSPNVANYFLLNNNNFIRNKLHIHKFHYLFIYSYFNYFKKFSSFIIIILYIMPMGFIIIFYFFFSYLKTLRVKLYQYK